MSQSRLGLGLGLGLDPSQSDESMCDMTVNPHVGKERGKKSGRVGGDHSKRGIDTLNRSIGLVPWLVLLVLWINGINSVVIPLFIAMSIVQLCLQTNAHPTNIIVDALGLSLAWRSQTDQYSLRLAWSDLKQVEFVPAIGAACDDPAGGVLVLSYQRPKNLFSSWPIYLDFDSLAQSGGLMTLWRLVVDARLQLAIPLDIFTLESDMERFVRFVGKHLAADRFDWDPAFAALIGGQAQVSYTRMWLDDMSSFRRRREGALPEAALVLDGRYRIEGQIARGGQARVYRAWDLIESTSVVLKEFVLPVDAGVETRGRSFASVKNEALLLASLNHPGIVRLLDHFVEDHRAYLVMQDLPGRSIKQIVEESGPLSHDMVVSIAKQMLGILAYLHGLPSPIVHRDISPDNIMVTDDGRVVLLDFNVALTLESNSTRTVVGKHNYMAPEQFKGRANCQSDLYGLGATLAFAITGCAPKALTQSTGAILHDLPLSRLIADLTALDCAERCCDANAAEMLLDDITSDATGDDGLDQTLDGGWIKLLASESH